MSDEAKFVMTTIAGLLTGGLIQAFFNRRKTASDAYSIMVEALVKGVNALGDSTVDIKGMIDMLVELPQLKSQLRTAQTEIAELQRQSSFWISFGRKYYDGSMILHAQVLRINVEQPEFEPGKFPTGPLTHGTLGSGAVAQ